MPATSSEEFSALYGDVASDVPKRRRVFRSFDWPPEKSRKAMLSASRSATAFPSYYANKPKSQVRMRARQNLVRLEILLEARQLQVEDDISSSENATSLVR